MKVNAHSQSPTKKPVAPAKQPAQPEKLSNDDIAAKIRAKFGKTAEIKKVIPKVEDKVELNSKGVVSSDEEEFGDIGKNDPKSEVTQERLKGLLKGNGFNFSDKERKALGEILS